MASASELIARIQRIVQDRSFEPEDILDYINRGIQEIAQGMMVYYPDGTQVLSEPLPDLVTSYELTSSTSYPYVSLPTDFGRDLLQVTNDSQNNTTVEIFDSFDEFLSYYPGMSLTSQVFACCPQAGNLYYQGMPSTADTLTVWYHSIPATITADRTYRASTISFASDTKRIADSGNGLGSFQADDEIAVTIYGNTAHRNQKHVTVASVAGDGSYIVVNEPLVTQAAGNEVCLFCANDEPEGIPSHLQDPLLVNYAAWKILELQLDGADGAVAADKKKAEFNAQMIVLDRASWRDKEPFRMEAWRRD